MFVCAAAGSEDIFNVPAYSRDLVACMIWYFWGVIYVLQFHVLYHHLAYFGLMAILAAGNKSVWVIGNEASLQNKPQCHCDLVSVNPADATTSKFMNTEHRTTFLITPIASGLPKAVWTPRDSVTMTFLPISILFLVQSQRYLLCTLSGKVFQLADPKVLDSFMLLCSTHSAPLFTENISEYWSNMSCLYSQNLQLLRRRDKGSRSRYVVYGDYNKYIYIYIYIYIMRMYRYTISVYIYICIIKYKTTKYAYISYNMDG